MKLYKISQTVHTGDDTYDSAIVAAESPSDATKIHPDSGVYDKGTWYPIPMGEPSSYAESYWARPEQVQVEYIGEAAPNIKAGTVLCASFRWV